MKVWRVEHETLIDESTGFPAGPYRCAGKLEDESHRLALRNMSWAHCAEDHISPSADARLEYCIMRDEVCGLMSREALDTWFNEWHKTLSAAGFMISVYEVPKDAVRVGSNGQVVFKHSAATRVGAEFWEVIA
ncbi:hypothetical protein RKD49_005407 [Streptomyces glaucescens]